MLFLVVDLSGSTRQNSPSSTVRVRHGVEVSGCHPLLLGAYVRACVRTCVGVGGVSTTSQFPVFSSSGFDYIVGGPVGGINPRSPSRHFKTKTRAMQEREREERYVATLATCALIKHLHVRAPVPVNSLLGDKKLPVMLSWDGLEIERRLTF